MLEQFQQRIRRAILGVHWQDRITNARILEQADTTSIEAYIVRYQLNWAGHVRRMPDTRVPKQLLYAELSSGKRKTGGQWKRYKDQLKANLKKCEMDLQWETRADDRAYWRRTSRMGVANLARRRITTEADKRARPKNRKYDNDTSDSAVCVCNVQSQIQDFPKEAAPFVWSAKSTRFSGGGVVAEFFRGLQRQKPTRFSGGGGVVAEFFFSVASKSRRDSVGGRGTTMNVPLMGPFYIFWLSPESATDVCGRICRSAIGIYSHQRTHRA